MTNTSNKQHCCRDDIWLLLGAVMQVEMQM